MSRRRWHPFRKRKDAFVDPEARSPELGLKYKDLQVMDELMKHGADLTEPRHVVFFSYAPSEEAAESIAHEGRARGLDCEVREPLPDYPRTDAGASYARRRSKAGLTPSIPRPARPLLGGL